MEQLRVTEYGVFCAKCDEDGMGHRFKFRWRSAVYGRFFLHVEDGSVMVVLADTEFVVEASEVEQYGAEEAARHALLELLNSDPDLISDHDKLFGLVA